MAGINKVILIGNLGAKPEMKYTQTGVPVTSFTLATSEYAGKDESGNRKEHTEWHKITAWRGLAETCEKYLDKGSKVYIEGKIRTDKWTDQNNVTRWTTKIIMDNMIMLSPKGTRESVGEYEGDVPEAPSSSGTSFPSGAKGAKGVTDIELDGEDDLDQSFL